MPAVAHQLIGREQELESVLGLFETPHTLPGALVLHGDAGIGKSSLWKSGVAAAADGGFMIVSSRPAEPETALSYAGLGDLLEDAAGEVIPELPPIQRRALEAALLLGEPGAHADERAVGAALLAALRLLASRQRLCLAIDDLQWLDPASSAALRFALTRLHEEPIGLLLTVRGTPPTWLLRSLPEAGPGPIEIRGLSIGATYELLRERLGITLARPTLLRLWETSAGNPFFALELGSALERRGDALVPGDPLPITSQLEELLRDRLQTLSPRALETARIVAAVADPTVDLVEAALGGSADAPLSEALDARVLELDGTRVRFTHPLLGSAVSTRTPGAKRSLHARLAKLAPTDEERARHLALSTSEPSDEVATALDAAARAAHDRGASSAAAELAEQALQLTQLARNDDLRRRRFAAAELQHVAGDTGRAIALLEEACAEAVPGRDRAAVLVKLAELQTARRAPEKLYRRALAESEADQALEATIHLGLARLMRWGDGLVRGAFHADLATRAARRTGERALECCALAMQASWTLRAGGGLSRSQADEALALERALPEWPLFEGPTELITMELVWTLELDRARRLLLELRDARRRLGDAEGEATALWTLALLEWRAGDWAEAEQCAAESNELLEQLGRDDVTSGFPSAVIGAHRGRADETRPRSRDAVARGEAAGVQIEQSGHEWVLGFIELSLGDAAAALPHLQRSYDLRDAFMLEPGMRLELGDLLEALVAGGELGEAEKVIDVWQARAAAVDRSWALAILARGRGLVLAARGDLEGALAAFEQALVEHERSNDPFHHARTLLALGKTQRRAKKRGAARTTLSEALARFEQLGAPLWAEQTRAELARIGGRAPSRGELTEAERRIAGLVAEGRTNREVAAALFLTEHSVETALTRIYRKLGVRSRAELTRLRAEGD